MAPFTSPSSGGASPAEGIARISRSSASVVPRQGGRSSVEVPLDVHGLAVLHRFPTPEAPFPLGCAAMATPLSLQRHAPNWRLCNVCIPPWKG